ncbi:hypothetical protein ACTA71_007358 [Dictyostelium dimigraforme]
MEKTYVDINVSLPGTIITTDVGHIHITTPSQPSDEGYNCEAQGIGSFTGLGYTIPAHSKGTIKTKIEVMAMTSDDIDHMNQLVESMLSASKKDEIKEQTKTSTSANLSFWSFFTGGDSASASYEDTKNTMHSCGLTQEQISIIINELYKMAEKMDHVELNLECDNGAFEYEVSGSIYLYTIAGTVKTAKGTKHYRMLSHEGTAGSPDNDNAPPVKGKITPLKKNIKI